MKEDELTKTENFNPRTHIGCDLGYDGERLKEANFNPRTHIGCD